MSGSKRMVDQVFCECLKMKWIGVWSRKLEKKKKNAEVNGFK